MHVYVIAVGLSGFGLDELSGAVVEAGRDFALDEMSCWAVGSRAGGVAAAGVHHGPRRCGRRRYVHRESSEVAFFDGLPVDPQGRISGFDAAQVASCWGSLSGELEGAFSAVRVDLEGERVEVVLDAMGLCPVYVARSGAGFMVSSSVAVITSLLGLAVPDPLGVSSFLGLGWAAGDRVLREDVRLLAGGARHTFHEGRLITSRGFGPAAIARGELTYRSAAETAGHLCGLVRNATVDVGRVGCALTAGRDTRLLAALMRAAGVQAMYFTGGSPESPDVVIARELADRFELEHQVVSHSTTTDEVDWTEAAARLVAQNDGLCSLLQLQDYVETGPDGPPLGVTVGGLGGEIGRAGTGALTAIATNVPLLRRSLRAQRKLLALKARDEAGLMTPAAVEELSRYLNRFCEERLQEGWPAWGLQEAFYTFERVGRWATTGTRRAAGSDDAFSPLATRAFIDYAFSLTPGERYVEAAHHRLLQLLAPEMLAHRFETPFPAQRAWAAPALATRQLARLLTKQLRARTPRPHRERSGSGGVAPQPEYPWQHEWFEQRLGLIGELFADQSSTLWEYVSRPRVLELLTASPVERARHQEALLRATTLAWHFHGPRPNRSVRVAVPAAGRTAPGGERTRTGRVWRAWHATGRDRRTMGDRRAGAAERRT